MLVSKFAKYIDNDWFGEMLEDFKGIEYRLDRDKDLIVSADPALATFSVCEDIVHIMNKDIHGRTAVFLKDCKYIRCDDELIELTIYQGTPSYIKELHSHFNRPVSKEEAITLDLRKLW